MISWSVGSDPGCPARDVAPPSVGDKHKQLLDHRQAVKRGTGREGRRTVCFVIIMHKGILPKISIWGAIE